MGLLKHFKSRSRLKESAQPITHHPPIPTRYGPDLTQRLPDKVLKHIFTYVCPHTLDTSYDSCEQSQIGDGCMLCDMRDLAHCASACRKWYGLAQKLLYTSVRIDQVHYCELEVTLGEKRKKAFKAFRGKPYVEPVDVPNIRLSLLCKTVRDSPALAAQTLFLKVSYMTREVAKGELARTVAALPNLRFVDLPEGFFAGDPSCLGLRQELQARCPDIRKMTYRSGSEEALELLVHRHWQAIEVVDLSSLAIELATLRIVLASLPTLHELTLSDMPWMDDTVFQPSPGQLPDFPPLQSLKLVDIPNIMAQGLISWLQTPIIRGSLHSLTLENTGVAVPDLHTVLYAAGALQHLSILEIVSRSLALAIQQLPPLTSPTLRTMHYEITSSEDLIGLQKPADSYYAYLATSLHQNALPALTTLYVRDQSFPEILLLPPVPTPFAHGSDAFSLKSKPSNISTHSSTRSAPFPPGGFGAGGGAGGFSQPLEIFSKGIDELEWMFTAIQPPTARAQRGSFSNARPLSQYSASRGLGPQWAHGGFGGEARKSVVVGNGFGGFLAVPLEEVPRLMTAEGGEMRWGSVGSQATAGSGGGAAASFTGFSRPAAAQGGSLHGSAGSRGSGEHMRKGSRHDLWR